jgi:hypothetical protein
MVNMEHLISNRQDVTLQRSEHGYTRSTISSCLQYIQAMPSEVTVTGEPSLLAVR